MGRICITMFSGDLKLWSYFSNQIYFLIKFLVHKIVFETTLTIYYMFLFEKMFLSNMPRENLIFEVRWRATWREVRLPPQNSSLLMTAWLSRENDGSSSQVEWMTFGLDKLDWLTDTEWLGDRTTKWSGNRTQSEFVHEVVVDDRVLEEQGLATIGITLHSPWCDSRMNF